MSKPQQLQDLPVDLIEPNLEQPRRYFDEATLQELAASVRERGVLQPVLVRPLEDGRYGLVTGERRWRAAQIAGLATIPALVSAYDDLAALEVGLIENMARENLNPVEEARACEILVEELGLSYQQIGDRVGSNKAKVANLMRLLQLSEEILELVADGKLSEAHGRALLIAKDPEARQELAHKAIEEGWSTRVLAARAHESNVSEPKPKERDAEQEPDLTAMNVARVWGDALGAEVTVRTLRGRQLRVEVVFDSPEGAFALGGQIAEQVARGKKRK